MKKFSHLFITFGFLLAALVCYVIGTTKGAGFFVVLGVLFELYFWYRFFKRIHARQSV